MVLEGSASLQLLALLPKLKFQNLFLIIWCTRIDRGVAYPRNVTLRNVSVGKATWKCFLPILDSIRLGLTRSFSFYRRTRSVRAVVEMFEDIFLLGNFMYWCVHSVIQIASKAIKMCQQSLLVVSMVKLCQTIAALKKKGQCHRFLQDKLWMVLVPQSNALMTSHT